MKRERKLFFYSLDMAMHKVTHWVTHTRGYLGVFGTIFRIKQSEKIKTKKPCEVLEHSIFKAFVLWCAMRGSNPQPTDS